MYNRAFSVYLSVADTLNFSRSAQSLHMSVSAVSRTIARLEQEVGQPLLERDRRQVRLTGAGREFRKYAGDALADWHALRRRLGSDGDLAGEVSLYCSVTATHSVLAPILAAFRAAHPAVDIMMRTGDQADGIARVLEGLDDVSVSGRPDHLPARLEFLPLLESPLRFCAPAADCQVRDLVLRGNASAAGVDWESIPFIVPERGVTKDLLEQWFQDRGVTPRIYAQVAGHEAIVAMVSLGLGVGVAPQLVVETSGSGEGVESENLPQELPNLAIGLCSLARRLENPLVRALWDVAAQTYRG